MMIDSAFGQYLLDMRTPFGILFFSRFTNLGAWYIVAALVLCACAIWLYKKQYSYIRAFFLTVVGAECTTYLLKILVARPRPVLALLPELSYSFPSGHTVIAVALYGFFTYVVLQDLSTGPHRSWRMPILAFNSVIILLIGFSRLYLGLHYLSDVVAGFVLGGVWLTLGIFFLKRSRFQENKSK